MRRDGASLLPLLIPSFPPPLPPSFPPQVKFGADEILNAAGQGFTDEDIDLILQKGRGGREGGREGGWEGGCSSVQHKLANFTLWDDTEKRISRKANRTPSLPPLGEAKTEEQSAKYQTNVQHNLAKFTLLDDTEERNLFEFEGEDYSNKRKDGTFL